MKLRYNLYRIYQVIPHISYSLISNNSELIIALLFGKTRIPLKLKDSEIKFEFKKDQILCMLNLLKIISFSKNYEINSNGILSLSFDGISTFEIKLTELTTTNERLINFLADAFANSANVIPKSKLSKYIFTDRDFIIDEIDGEPIIECFNGVKFFVKYSNYPIVETFSLKMHEILPTIPELKDKIVVDIGADTGNTALYFASKGAQVYAVEIDERRYKIIQEHLKINPDLAKRIIPINAAFGSEGEVEFYSDPLDFMDPSIFKERYEEHIEKAIIKKVKGCTIPSLISEFNIKTIDYLKMDCKGAEFTLKPDHLEMVENIKIEYMALAKEHKIENLIELFTKSGFKIRLFKHDSSTRKSFNIGGNIFATKDNLSNFQNN
tara:strand:+ start:3692 stop:4831 length:1140 start_codon:yes stop_codon:yes gene_type:complete